MNSLTVLLGATGVLLVVAVVLSFNALKSKPEDAAEAERLRREIAALEAASQLGTPSPLPIPPATLGSPPPPPTAAPLVPGSPNPLPAVSPTPGSAPVAGVLPPSYDHNVTQDDLSIGDERKILTDQRRIKEGFPDSEIITRSLCIQPGFYFSQGLDQIGHD
jgi:hypothetical protein